MVFLYMASGLNKKASRGSTGSLECAILPPAGRSRAPNDLKSPGHGAQLQPSLLSVSGRLITKFHKTLHK
jgi:hypothetical protein